jgi:hypothetical protein
MYVYEGLATVTVLARYLGHPPVELTTLECPVRVSNAGPGRTRIGLQHYLQGPKDANTLRVILPDGLLIQGPIIDGCNEPTGGWLLIDVQQYDLAVDQPASLDGWKWQ